MANFAYLFLILSVLFLARVTKPEDSPSDGDEDEDGGDDDDQPQSHHESDYDDNQEPVGRSPCESYKIVFGNLDKVLDCQRETHTHPRQSSIVIKNKTTRTPTQKEQFHFLAIFSIKYDLDFQEAGDRCSVRLYEEWLLREPPVPLDEYSYNRIWYERLCNPFSFLECIPDDQVRVKGKRTSEACTLKCHNFIAASGKKVVAWVNPHESHKHAGALPDGHGHLPATDNVTKSDLPAHFPPKEKNISLPLLDYNDSGRDTSRLHRWYIGGRGPGKGRHKSGPGAQRVDPAKILGMPAAIPIDGYPLDGVCVCSADDPMFPDRRRPIYGMDFVEDELRPDWCVSRPGGLCGRILFWPNTWPSQDFYITDHIPCPRRYKGVEYECVRWSLLENKDNEPQKWKKPWSYTATCERKQEIVEGAMRSAISSVVFLLVLLPIFVF